MTQSADRQERMSNHRRKHTCVEDKSLHIKASLAFSVKMKPT